VHICDEDADLALEGLRCDEVAFEALGVREALQGFGFFIEPQPYRRISDSCTQLWHEPGFGQPWELEARATRALCRETPATQRAVPRCALIRGHH
jgi:hypothetical protein